MTPAWEILGLVMVCGFVVGVLISWYGASR